jgi:hypothetical protein
MELRREKQNDCSEEINIRSCLSIREILGQAFCPVNDIQ